MDAALVTIRDVAREAQVSIGTVSRIINGNTTVRPAMRKAVLDAIAELKFRPDPHAQGLRSLKTKNIGLLVGDIASPDMVALIQELETESRRLGYSIQISICHFDGPVADEIIIDFVRRRVDGIVLGGLDPGILKRFSGIKTPMVVAGGVELQGISSVVGDAAKATSEVLHELVNLGHRDIAVVAKGGDPFGTAMTRSLARKIRAFGLSVQSTISTHDGDDACPEIVKLLDAESRPSAIFSITPALSSVLITLRQLGLKVPRDISLVSIGDRQLGVACSPPVSSIELDVRYQAKEAVRLLFHELRGSEGTPELVKVPAFYVRRLSIGPNRVGIAGATNDPGNSR